MDLSPSKSQKPIGFFFRTSLKIFHANLAHFWVFFVGGRFHPPRGVFSTTHRWVGVVPLAVNQSYRGNFSRSQSWHPHPPDCPRWSQIWDFTFKKKHLSRKSKSSQLSFKEWWTKKWHQLHLRWDWSEEPWTSFIPGPCIGETANSLQDAGASRLNFGESVWCRKILSLRSLYSYSLQNDFPLDLLDHFPSGFCVDHIRSQKNHWNSIQHVRNMPPLFLDHSATKNWTPRRSCMFWNKRLQLRITAWQRVFQIFRVAETTCS